MILLVPGCKSKICTLVLAYAPFNIYISDSAHDDLFSQQHLGSFPRDSVKLYHFNSKGIINYDSVLVNPLNNSNHSVYSIHSEDALKQSVSGIHTFYFKRGYHVIDTIFFDESVSGPCDDYKLNSFKYNGVNIMPFDSIVVPR